MTLTEKKKSKYKNAYTYTRNAFFDETVPLKCDLGNNPT